MKNLFSILANILVLLVFNSCSSVDKNKCTSDYIVDRVCKIYDVAFTQSNYGCGNVELGLESCASKQLKEILIAKDGILQENTIPNFFTGYNFLMDMEYEADPGDPYVGTQEELMEIAKQGKTLDFRFTFSYKIFYPNGRYKSDFTAVTLQLIYEETDWMIDNIIYDEKSDSKTLKQNLELL